jgi:hypothetical protein
LTYLLETALEFSPTARVAQLLVSEFFWLVQYADYYALDDLKDFLIIDTPGLLKCVPVILSECPKILNGFDEEISVVSG